jgi:hypothetical protein
MKRLFLLLMLLVSFATVKSQSQPVMYPEDRTNRVFLSSLSSSITYGVSFALMNQHDGYKKHLYPILTTMGVNVCLGGLSYLLDPSGSVNKRQNLTAWFGGSIVSVTILRIGLN